MNEPRKTKVAFIDDHTLVRTGLVGLVNRLGGYEVVLEAEDGWAFTKAMEAGPEIDIAIVDLNMPIMDGWATIAWLYDNHPHIKSIALTFDGSETAAIRAIHEGARGFLLKNVKPEVFKQALDSVRDTGYYEYYDNPHPFLKPRDLKTSYERQQETVLAMITDRELEFIRLACAPEEYTYDAIADQMAVRPSTIEAFRKHVYDRFHIKSKAGLVIFAYRWGLVQVVKG
jgi:two-component system, NarL family, invasion response regulator UvrY